MIKNGLLVFSNSGFDLLENTYENHIDGMGQTTSTNSNFFLIVQYLDELSLGNFHIEIYIF